MIDEEQHEAFKQVGLDSMRRLEVTECPSMIIMVTEAEVIIVKSDSINLLSEKMKQVLLASVNDSIHI